MVKGVRVTLLSKIGRVNLRKEFAIRFSADDLRIMSFDLGIHYDSLAGETIDVKSVSLITHCERLDVLGDLLKACQGLRPNVDWLHVADVIDSDVERPESNEVSIAKQDEESGFLDIVENVERDFELANTLLVRMSKAIQQFGETMSVRTSEMNALIEDGNKPDRSTIKRLLSLVAQDLDNFSSQIDADLPEFSRSFLTGVQSMGDAAGTLADFGESKRQEIESVNPLLVTLRDGLDTAQQGMNSFRETVATLPRMVSELTRSRNRATEVLDKLLAEFDLSRQTIYSTELKVQHLLNKMRTTT